MSLLFQPTSSLPRPYVRVLRPNQPTIVLPAESPSSTVPCYPPYQPANPHITMQTLTTTTTITNTPNGSHSIESRLPEPSLVELDIKQEPLEEKYSHSIGSRLPDLSLVEIDIKQEPVEKIEALLNLTENSEKLGTDDSSSLSQKGERDSEDALDESVKVKIGDSVQAENTSVPAVSCSSSLSGVLSNQSSTVVESNPSQTLSSTAKGFGIAFDHKENGLEESRVALKRRLVSNAAEFKKAKRDEDNNFTQDYFDSNGLKNDKNKFLPSKSGNVNSGNVCIQEQNEQVYTEELEDICDNSYGSVELLDNKEIDELWPINSIKKLIEGEIIEEIIDDRNITEVQDIDRKTEQTETENENENIKGEFQEVWDCSNEKYLEGKTPNGFFRCEYCQELFHTKKALTTHKGENHASFRCMYCDKVFITKIHFNAHLRRVHKIDISRKKVYKVREVKCHVCGENLQGRKALRSHLSENHPSNTYPCTLCSLISISKGGLHKHLREIHNTTLGKLQVKDKSVVQSSAVEKLTVKDKPVVTDKTKFAEVKSEKPQVCPVCDRTFVGKKSLRLHMLQVHLMVKKGDSWEKCEADNSKFSTFFLLNYFNLEVVIGTV